MQKKTIIFKIDEELKNKIKAKAKQYGFTLSNYIKMLIMKDLNND